MTTKYVNSAAAGAGTGADWTNAYSTLGDAVTAAADVILVHNAHSESLASNTTYTFTKDTIILCVNKDSGDVLSTGALVGAQATCYEQIWNGAYKVKAYGLTIKNGTDGTANNLIFNSTDGGHFRFDSCTFDLRGSNAGNALRFGSGSAGEQGFTELHNCTYRAGATGHLIRFLQFGEAHGFTVDAAGSAPTIMSKLNVGGANWEFTACDFSKVTGTLFEGSNGGGGGRYTLRSCKLGSGVTIFSAVTGILNRGATELTAYDCASGDTHYNFYHGDPFGSTQSVVNYYATAGSVDQNSTHLSHKIITTANCSFSTPYCGPWIARPHTATAAITPSFEGLRVGSTTVIQDDEVWGEWEYKGTSGVPLTTTVKDQATPAATVSGANQTSSLTYADWTNATSADSVFKLAPSATITPAEVGHIYGRVVVGEPSLTVYYDPQIRIA